LQASVCRCTPTADAIIGALIAIDILRALTCGHRTRVSQGFVGSQKKNKRTERTQYDLQACCQAHQQNQRSHVGRIKTE
jgi:hypothetical protein